jgi:hypothetical protein
MPLMIGLTAAYLVVNLALMVWLERERAAGRTPAPRVVASSNVLRYGPALLGAGYLVTLAGDWLFFLFVLGFFAMSFWLMDGLLAVNPASRTDVMRGGGPERGVEAPRRTDRDG